jgi:hypothetical protein
VNNEFATIWRKAVVAKFEALSLFPRRAEENHENPQDKEYCDRD